MQTPSPRPFRLAPLPLACAGLAALGAAAFTMGSAPTWRGSPDTAFGGWESFVEPDGGDNPADDAASTTGAVLVQTVPGAILTGGGNIYHPSAAPRFVVRDSVACDLQEVWLQVSTWGAVLDPGSARLELLDCGGSFVAGPAPTLSVLTSYPNPMGLGTNEELLFTWELGGLSDDVREFRLLFEGASGNISLDALMLDTRTDCASPDGCDLGTAYCFGDGGGAPCPCGNTGAPGAGCANSADSAGARLAASGSLSLAAGDLTLSGDGLVPNQAGLFFQGEHAVGGGAGMVFGDGIRCAGANVVRLQTVVPDAGGHAQTSVDVGARGGVSAGETRYYQLWYRDPSASPCGAGFNLSNGLELTWAD